MVETALAQREDGLQLQVSRRYFFAPCSHSAPLELELAPRNIPFVKFGGLKFLEAAHIKDVLALLRWAENPRDRVSGFRAIQLLAGMGPKTAARVMDDAGAAGAGRSLRDAAGVPALAREGWARFAALIDRLAGRADAVQPAPPRVARGFRARLPLVRGADAAPSTTTPRCGCSTSANSRASRQAIRIASVS